VVNQAIASCCSIDNRQSAIGNETGPRLAENAHRGFQASLNFGESEIENPHLAKGAQCGYPCQDYERYGVAVMLFSAVTALFLVPLSTRNGTFVWRRSLPVSTIPRLLFPLTCKKSELPSRGFELRIMASST
jgi:hypothetical protein